MCTEAVKVAAEGLKKRVGGERGKLLPDLVLGHRVGWVGVGSRGLLWAEGHPGAALGVDGLLSPDRLPEALSGVVEALWAEGVPVPGGVAGSDALAGELLQGVEYGRPGFAGIRRCDGTVDMRFPPAQGVAVLAGVTALFREMRGQAECWWEPGAGGRAVQTAYLRGFGGKRVLGRWYDKGAERLEAVRGSWIRGEDQRRYAKGSRRDVQELTSGYVRGKWCERFAPLWRASRGVTVAGPVVLMNKLGEAVSAGEVTHAKARDVALAMCESLGSVRLGSRASHYRWHRSARELGYVLGDGLVEDVEVDLHSVIEAALETDAWERRG